MSTLTRFAPRGIAFLFLLSFSLPAWAAEAATSDGPEGVVKTSDWLAKLMPSWLKTTVVLLEHWQWLGLLSIIALGVIFDRVTALAIRRLLKRLFGDKQDKVPKELWAKAERPFGLLVFGLTALITLPWLALPPGTLGTLNLAATVISAIAGVWAAYRLVDLLSLYFVALARKSESKLDDMLVPMVRKILKVFVVAIGIVFVAQNLGIEVGSLLAGLGLGGLAFALAAKDTVSNIFGSITVLLDQSFQVGDWVVIDGVEGTVERVGFRSTRIRTFYNSLVTLPNARLIDGVVDNFGARSYRRYKAKFGLNFDTPPDRVEAFCEGLRELVRLHPYTRKNYFHVYLNDFSDSALDVLIYIFHECPDWSTELRERHRFLLDALRLGKHLGVDYAFPTRTLHVAGTGVQALAGQAEDLAPRDGSLPTEVLPTSDEALEAGRKAALAVVRKTLAEGEIPPPVG